MRVVLKVVRDRYDVLIYREIYGTEGELIRRDFLQKKDSRALKKQIYFELPPISARWMFTNINE